MLHTFVGQGRDGGEGVQSCRNSGSIYLVVPSSSWSLESSPFNKQMEKEKENHTQEILVGETEQI